jgi:ribokinase
MTKRPRIGVVGSSNIDLVTYVERMPVWGETIAAPRFEMNHGGKGANQAVAAAKLGAEVVMVSKVGDDMLGDGVLSNFKETNVGVAHVRRTPAQSTGTATPPATIASSSSRARTATSRRPTSRARAKI